MQGYHATHTPQSQSISYFSFHETIVKKYAYSIAR